MNDLGVVVAQICGGEKWSDCWCDKEKRDGGCRHCQTYQIMYGLPPTCGDNGKIVKIVNRFSMREYTRSDEKYLELVEQQKRMNKEGYK